jgi:hypothetical protein
MVCFQTKNPNLGKFWRALDWKMLISCTGIWNILWTFGIYFSTICVHLVQLFRFWCIMHQVKSGNPGADLKVQAIHHSRLRCCFGFIFCSLPGIAWRAYQKELKFLVYGEDSESRERPGRTNRWDLAKVGK